MSDEADNGSTGARFQWRHWLAVSGAAVVVIAVVVAVFLVVKDADEPSSGDEADQRAVEAVYHRFANAVQSSDVAAAGICADRSEPKDTLTRTAGMLGGIGTAGSTIRVNIASVTVTGDVAHVDGSLNTMGTNVAMPLEVRRIDDAWCVWS
ncbi:hypothetical protein [Gordonia hydrophobica]|uniref:Uncharacterized protein n=1 Tax=Gordonia hydrophobica TaxID=40516 RepID=A0ABZ2TZ60_9ACTN|nr:hypothetical protein [Gordonia hydrophobica]MBM7369335.1 hypothetical protein [Gordonia hydrophobica]